MGESKNEIVLQDLRNTVNSEQVDHDKPKGHPLRERKVVEATGWIVNQDGHVELVADTGSHTSKKTVSSKVRCEK
ncbi:MAG: hypothetical protein AAF757_23210 [Cyanobacteria bacterium P01_D01_bin.116]